MAAWAHSYDVSAAHLLAIEDRLTALEELVHEHLMRADPRAAARPWYAWAEAQQSPAAEAPSSVHAWYAWAEEPPVVRSCATCDKARDRRDGFVYCTRDPVEWVMSPSDRPPCSDFGVMAASA